MKLNMFNFFIFMVGFFCLDVGAEANEQPAVSSAGLPFVVVLNDMGTAQVHSSVRTIPLGMWRKHFPTI